MEYYPKIEDECNNIFISLENYTIKTHTMIYYRMESEAGCSVPPEDTTYLQCRTARRLARSGEVVDVTPGPVCGTLSTAPLPVMGDLTPDDFSFRGARKQALGSTVNQNASFSFDPANLQCLACQKEHSIINVDRPVVIAFSDQNFVPAITGGDVSVCIPTVKLEDASLNDLTTLSFELLENLSVGNNFVIMLGSATHLACVGTASYASDWTRCIQRFKGKWSDAIILPLFPIPSTNWNIGLARELTELATWFEKLYRSTPYGLTSAWASAIRAFNAASVGLQPLQNPDVYTLSLPATLSYPSPALSVRFTSKISRPTATNAFSRKASCELVRCLVENLNSDLHIGFVLKGDLLKDSGKSFVEVAKDPPSGLAVVGASHMSRCIPIFSLQKGTVFNLTKPGWIATPANVAKVMDDITQANLPVSTPVILDLLSNSVFRFVDFDGSLLLPKKTQTGYHMPGDITLCDNRSIERLIDNVMPIFEMVSDSPKIVIPPQPRYIFESCCADPEHGTNLGNEGYKEMILGNLSRIRNLMKHELLKREVKNFWVLDSFSIVGGAKLSDYEVVVNNLAVITADDGVHFSLLGYQNLSDEITKAVGDLLSGKIGNVKTRNVEGKPGRFFWRGFHSRIGSVVHPHQSVPFGRKPTGGGGRYHPYRRN